MIYRLSDEGRKMTYFEWRKIGGCGMPNWNMTGRTLGPMARWDVHTLTLGEIEDACPGTGRSFARFAVEHLGRTLLSSPYKP